MIGDCEAEVTKGDFQGDGVLARAGGNRNAFETSEQLAEATTAAAMRSFRIVLNSGVAKRLGYGEKAETWTVRPGSLSAKFADRPTQACSCRATERLLQAVR